MGLDPRRGRTSSGAEYFVVTLHSGWKATRWLELASVSGAPVLSSAGNDTGDTRREKEH
jgi:hypothetical protein